MIASSSSARLARPALLASVGSAARSSRPIAAHRRLKTLSPLAGDQHVLAVLGEVGVGGHDPDRLLPLRSRTMPHMSYSGSVLSSMENTASYSATFTTWPRAAAVHVAMVQGHHRTDDAMQRGERIADREMECTGGRSG